MAPKLSTILGRAEGAAVEELLHRAHRVGVLADVAGPRIDPVETQGLHFYDQRLQLGPVSGLHLQDLSRVVVGLVVRLVAADGVGGLALQMDVLLLVADVELQPELVAVAHQHDIAAGRRPAGNRGEPLVEVLRLRERQLAVGLEPVRARGRRRGLDRKQGVVEGPAALARVGSMKNLAFGMVALLVAGGPRHRPERPAFLWGNAQMPRRRLSVAQTG